MHGASCAETRDETGHVTIQCDWSPGGGPRQVSLPRGVALRSIACGGPIDVGCWCVEDVSLYELERPHLNVRVGTVMSHWLGSNFFWAVTAGILALAQVILGLFAIVMPSVLARKKITYELLTAEPLINLPAGINPSLQVSHDGKPLDDPHVVVVRLAYRGRRDLTSIEFDQGGPLCVDVGIEIKALLRSSFSPPKQPFPKIKVNGTALDIGPSLIRKRLEMIFVILANGPAVRLECHGPLPNVDIEPLEREEHKLESISRLKTITGWALLALIIWWVIEDPAGAAQVVHNIGTFLSNAASRITHFFASI